MIKKIALIVVFSFFVQQSFAQFRLGPIIGTNFNRQTFKSNGIRFQEQNFNSRMGFNVGAIGDLFITNYLSLQPELIYSHKGGYYALDYAGVVSETYRSNIGYIMMPVLLTGKLDVKKALLFFGAGPYLSKVMVNNHYYDQNGQNVEAGKLKMGTNSSTDQLKPWDAGIKIKAGVELKRGFFMNAFYDFGTADINPQFTVTRNKTIGVQIGYIFSLTEEDKYNRFNNFYEF